MLNKLTIEQINKGIQNKEFGYLELVQSYEKNFNQFQFLNVDISKYWEQAKQQAQKLDSIGVQQQTHPLMGVPIAIKDMFLVKNTKTTAASKVLENFVAPYESFTTSKLNDAGYIMPFKTNLDEFAMGSSNETSYFGACFNPWILSDRKPRVPGGSSGGSAACVASYMSLGALGTDTGGSVRQPASFCGVVGFKPTYGRCSRRGVVAFASSLDQPGVFARNVQDACYIMETIAGHDLQDATSLKSAVPKLSATLANVNGKKIGVCSKEFEHMNDEYKAEYKNLIAELTNAGAIIEDVEMPSFEMALKIYFIIAPAEAASNLARYDGLVYGSRLPKHDSYADIVHGTRSLFGKEVKRRILIGNFVLNAAEYDQFFGKATKLKAQIIHQMDEIFSKFDAILLPTTPNIAFAAGEQRSAIEMYREDLYTILANIYGGPAISVPLCAVSSDIQAADTTINEKFSALKSQEKMPMGIQIMAKRENEIALVEVAKQIEVVANWQGWKND